MIIHKPILYCLISFFFLSCNETAISPFPTILFEKKATLPGTGRASAVAFGIGGKGYVGLGRTELRSGALNDLWQYNPDSNSWKQKTSFPGIARVKAMAAVVNGMAFVGLGYNINQGVYTNGNLKDFWMYNPVLNNWTKKKDFPSTATDACVSFVLNNVIYVGEGFNESGFTNEFWKYEPEQDSWSRLKDFPGISRMGAVLSSTGDRIFFGTGYRDGNCNDWWEYFPVSDSWKQLKSMPDNGRENGVSFSINNRIFVATGRHFGGDLTGGHVDSDMLEYDVNRNVWYVRGNIPDGGRENAVSFTINGKGYIGFGDNDTGVLNDFWSFEP